PPTAALMASAADTRKTPHASSPSRPMSPSQTPAIVTRRSMCCGPNKTRIRGVGLRLTPRTVGYSHPRLSYLLGRAQLSGFRSSAVARRTALAAAGTVPAFPKAQSLLAEPMDVHAAGYRDRQIARRACRGAARAAPARAGPGALPQLRHAAADSLRPARTPPAPRVESARR